MSGSYQEVFDKVKAALLAQGCRSMIGGYCRFRGDGGRKCAIGHLMTDEQMERHRVDESSNIREFPVALVKEIMPDVPPDDVIQFFHALQLAHDRSRPGPERNDFVDFETDFRNRMNHIAGSWKLKP